MIADLNKTSRIDQQRQFSMHAKAAAMYGHSSNNAKHTPATSQNTDTSDLMKLMQSMRKEQNHKTPPSKTPRNPSTPPAKPATNQDKAKPPAIKQILQTKGTTWQNTFGTRTVKGKKVKLCWFRCNHPTGCNQGNSCKQSHLAFPKAYKNAPLAKLPAATQWTVIASCKKN